MESVIVNMHKAVRKVRLSEDPDSPEFLLDLTDRSINRNAPVLAGASTIYLKTIAEMKEKGSTEETSRRLISCYGVMIDTLLGEGAFAKITEWLVDEGDVAPEAMTAVYAPIIEYLYSEFNMVITANKSKGVEKYLEWMAQRDADTI